MRESEIGSAPGRVRIDRARRPSEDREAAACFLSMSTRMHRIRALYRDAPEAERRLLAVEPKRVVLDLSLIVAVAPTHETTGTRRKQRWQRDEVESTVSRGNNARSLVLRRAHVAERLGPVSLRRGERAEPLPGLFVSADAAKFLIAGVEVAELACDVSERGSESASQILHRNPTPPTPAYR